MFIDRQKIVSNMEMQIASAEKIMHPKRSNTDAKVQKIAIDAYAEMKPLYAELESTKAKLKEYRAQYNFIARFFLFIADHFVVKKSEKEVTQINAYLDNLIPREERQDADSLLKIRDTLVEHEKIVLDALLVYKDKLNQYVAIGDLTSARFNFNLSTDPCTEKLHPLQELINPLGQFPFSANQFAIAKNLFGNRDELLKVVNDVIKLIKTLDGNLENLKTQIEEGLKTFQTLQADGYEVDIITNGKHLDVGSTLKTMKKNVELFSKLSASL